MDQTSSKRQASRAEIIAVVVLIGLLLWSARRASTPPIEIGIPMPEMMAQGWLNTDRPLSRDRLIGKIVVVDCWFLDCPPCRVAMPELADLYEKYHPLGVEFVGLTIDGSASLPQLQEFISQVPGFDWPVGYGSAPTLDQLGIEFFPTVLVFGPQGTTIWSSGTLDDLPEVLDEALAVESLEL